MQKFFVILALSIGVLGGSIWHLKHWGQHPALLSKPITIELKRGVSLRKLSRQLHRAQLIDSPMRFLLYVKVWGQYRQFQSGIYRFSKHIAPSGLVEKFQSGDIYEPVSLVLAIPEGFAHRDMVAKLEALRYPHVEEFRALLSNSELRQEFGIRGETLEGYLYPATYRFHHKTPKAKDIVRRMLKEFFKRLPPNYEKDLRSKGLSLQDAVTFASLIEKETLHPQEKNLISEVIWNRLNDKQPLGIDASLIYGIKDYQGDIKTKHLRDRTNLYNSRIHRGLPPTPICSVARSSLQAVLTPTHKGYYFYVLQPGIERRHHFSKTLKEHNQHVKRLVQYSRRTTKP